MNLDPGDILSKHVALLRPRAGVAILIVLSVIAVASLLWKVHPFILRSAALLWTVSDTLAPADAIVVLDGGSERPYAAAELYRVGLGSQILIDGEGARKDLSDLNIPPDAVETFGSGLRSTYEEACALKDWAGKHAVRRIIVPTEVFASRRVLWIFVRETKALGVETMIDVVPNRHVAADNWWRNKDGRWQFMSEIVKYTYYRVRYAFDQC